MSGRGGDPHELVEILHQNHLLWNTSRDSTDRIVHPELGVRRHVYAINSYEMWKRSFSVAILDPKF